ncbi:Actin-binding cofilin/tropomyosin type [Penicillium brevicompactum]|uniref:Cofilin n=1 Tax=Penicillium brevicompactum TaxID=5074 RepID=A0A9W9UH73_PENBR|nr:Actin-binding cofilin/tropomyosin type [Penicillium brevicompactum]
MTKGFAAFTPQVEETFDQVKETDTLDYVFYEANAHDKKIYVAGSGKYTEYTDFIAQFRDDTPRYAVVKFKYPAPIGSEERHKIVLITWVPEEAGNHDKSYYTSNKDHLYYSLDGISLHVQAHNQDELAHATILKQFKAL